MASLNVVGSFEEQRLGSVWKELVESGDICPRDWASELISGVRMRGFHSLDVVADQPGAACMLVLTERHGLFVLMSSWETAPTDIDVAYTSIVVPILHAFTLALGSRPAMLHVCWKQVEYSAINSDLFCWEPSIGMILNSCSTVDQAMDIIELASRVAASFHKLVEEYHAKRQIKRFPRSTWPRRPYQFNPLKYWDGAPVKTQPVDVIVEFLRSMQVTRE